MAEKLHFELVSPERLLMSADVDMVTVPGSEGDFGVLNNHAPFISTLRAGLLVVEDADTNQEPIFVRGGFADVTPVGLTVLAEEAMPLSEIDKAKLTQDIQDAGEDVADAKSDEARAAAQLTLDALNQLQEVLDAQ